MQSTTSTSRPSWTGVIRFGVLDVPVSLTAATSDADSPFVSVHAVDGGLIATEKRCKKCAAALDASDVARAVATGKGEHVLIDAAELAACETDSRHIVTLSQFPAASEMPAELVERVYYGAPADGGLLPDTREAYDLLRSALYLTKRAGIGKISFRSRERIVAVVGGESCLILYILRFPAEVRPATVVAPGTVMREQVDMAVRFIEHAKGAIDGRPWNLSGYRDDYTFALDSLVAAKQRPTRALDTAAALKASLVRQARRKAA
jgi:DNA end-binding protein Ku